MPCKSILTPRMRRKRGPRAGTRQHRHPATTRPGMQAFPRSPRPHSNRQPLPYHATSAVLGQREEDVKALISGVPGFISYAAVRTGDGGVTVTVCEDKAGTDESSRRAAEWVKENVSATANPPAITEGDTVLQFSAVAAHAS